MKRDIAPSGYLSIHEAIRIVAEVPVYTADDDEWLDFGDRLNDASAIDAATRELRQRLSDGELTAYVQLQAGKVSRIPEWTWADDGACLSRTGPDERFREFRFLHPHGVEIEGRRSQVYLGEKQFEAFRKGETEKSPAMGPKIKRRPGRPEGVGAFDDERWLHEIDKCVEEGLGPVTAANSIAAAHREDVERKGGTSDENVSHRLYRKWRDTRRRSSSE